MCVDTTTIYNITPVFALNMNIKKVIIILLWTGIFTMPNLHEKTCSFQQMKGSLCHAAVLSYEIRESKHAHNFNYHVHISLFNLHSWCECIQSWPDYLLFYQKTTSLDQALWLQRVHLGQLLLSTSKFQWRPCLLKTPNWHCHLFSTY